MKIIHILHPYCPKIVEHILKNKKKSKRVYTHEINHYENEGENEK